MKDTRKPLMILGIVQLVSYVALGWKIATTNTSDLGFGGSGDPFFTGAIGFNAYLMGAFTLIPSAIIFIIEPKMKNAGLVNVARILQLTLFIAVCVALLPAIAIGNITNSPWLTIACLLGIAYFPFMLVLVRKVVPAKVAQVPVAAPETQASPVSQTAKAQPDSLVNSKFCATCGSALPADGKCVNCA